LPRHAAFRQRQRARKIAERARQIEHVADPDRRAEGQAQRVHLRRLETSHVVLRFQSVQALRPPVHRIPPRLAALNDGRASRAARR